MNRLLSDTYRRSIDTRISRIVVAHKTARSGKVTTVLSRTAPNHVYREVSEKDAHHIYLEKCNDLEIAPNPLAEHRFVEQFLNSLLIKSLKFGGMCLGQGAVKALLQILWGQKKYVFIDLSMNRLNDDGAKLISNYIRSKPPIIHLDVRSNGIMVDGAISIFEALGDDESIVSLDLSAIDGIERNRIGTQGCKSLAELLIKNEILSHLNASMCGISSDGCNYLTEALAENKSLIYLDVSANRFGTLGTNNLFKYDHSLNTIETLILSKNGINDGCSKSLCRQIELSHSIRYLDLSDNGLTKNFLRKLYKAMQNSQIETLNLSRNKLGVDCAEILFLVIRDITSLQVLDLSYNILKDTAVIQICEGLRVNKSLISIDLTDTVITDTSGVNFGEVIVRNSALQKMVINNNRLTDISSVPIAKALSKNNSLIQLSLKSNEMRDDTAQVFIESLQQNNTIIDIEVDYNDFTYRTHVQLVNAIASHKKYISQNIVDYASRKIEVLKEDEQRLFEVRDEVKRQSDAVSSSLSEKDRKENLLVELTKKRENDIILYDSRLEEVKKEYEHISEERRHQLAEFNRVKTQTEQAQANALSKFQGIAAKRQHAAARLKRAHDKKIEIEVATNRVLDDLKLHLLTIKEQLRNAIDDAHIQQKALFQKEEEERLAAQAALLAEELFTKRKGGATGTSKRKVPTLSDRKNKKIKAAARQKPQQTLTPAAAAATTTTTSSATTAAQQFASRPKTAMGTPIVTPSINNTVSNGEL